MRSEKRKNNDKKRNGRGVTPTKIKKKQDFERAMNGKIVKELSELENSEAYLREEEGGERTMPGGGKGGKERRETVFAGINLFNIFLKK